MKTEQIALFTAQRVADAVVHAYGSDAVQAEVISGTAGLYYSIKLVGGNDKPLMLGCSSTTLEQLFKRVASLINQPA